MKKFLARNQGYTLVEIIVSIALIGIIAAGFLTAFSTGQWKKNSGYES
jgi:prepilin-type N-terminal cleavage/methylation domain-containing protein